MPLPTGPDWRLGHDLCEFHVQVRRFEGFEGLMFRCRVLVSQNSAGGSRCFGTEAQVEPRAAKELETVS